MGTPPGDPLPPTHQPTTGRSAEKPLYGIENEVSGGPTG
jgi:hypothetical protein